MKEYGIYTRHGDAKPFMVHVYNNLTQCKVVLYNIISDYEERGREYFVDNDFFNNKYSNSLRGTYFCIKVRDVSEYKKYSEVESTEEENKKIIYFQEYLK